MSTTTDGKGTSVFMLDKLPMAAEDLVRALKKRMAADREEAKETKLFITVDRNAKHANLIEALDNVKEAGLQKFGFSLKPGGHASPAPSAPRSAVPQR